jgi:hypothetical protein
MMDRKGEGKMPIELTCSCGKRLQVSEAFAGRQGQCPVCGKLLPIPDRQDTVIGAAPSEDKEAQAVLAAGFPFSKGSEAAEDAITPTPGSGVDLQAQQSGSPEADDNGKLTASGCVLTLLSVAVICVAALPIVRWRDPETGRPLPRFIAIVSPLLVGAIVHGIGSLLLRLIGLPVWSKRETAAKK